MAPPNVNIGGDPNDPSYRYKRPKLLTKIEGNGNGIKTVTTNIYAIATALKRPAVYIVKFFGIDLNAVSRVDDENERGIVNGVHATEGAWVFSGVSGLRWV